MNLPYHPLSRSWEAPALDFHDAYNCLVVKPQYQTISPGDMSIQMTSAVGVPDYLKHARKPGETQADRVDYRRYAVPIKQVVIDNKVYSIAIHPDVGQLLELVYAEHFHDRIKALETRNRQLDAQRCDAIIRLRTAKAYITKAPWWRRIAQAIMNYPSVVWDPTT